MTFLESFGDRLRRAVDRRRSQVLLGLDPHPAVAGGGTNAAEAFCRRALEAAGPACLGVKLQLACFERYGAPGWAAYERVAREAADMGLLVIVDAKRGDIGLTSEAYADALLRPPADAMTVNPMMGADAVEPFIRAAIAGGRGVFLLVRTSNPGARDLQDARLSSGEPWHELLARKVAEWGASSIGGSGLSAVGAVVGASAPDRLARLRELMPAQPFLMPGIGPQGANPDDLAAALGDHPASVLVPASRAVASAEDPRAAAESLRDRLAALRPGK